MITRSTAETVSTVCVHTTPAAVEPTEAAHLRRIGLVAIAAGILVSCFSDQARGVEPFGVFDPVTVSRSLWMLDGSLDDEDFDDEERTDVDGDDELDVDGDDDRDDDDDADDEGVGRLNRSIFGDREERQPSYDGGRFVLPALMAPTTRQTEIGNGKVPDGFREGVSEAIMQLPESLFERGLPGGYTIKNWAAPNTFSHPRFFEDRMLERHGHERFACVQPFASGFRFFATIPMLPYLATVRDPCDCEYTLGYYRVGNCAPVMLQRPPYERRAMIAEALTISGASAALP